MNNRKLIIKVLGIKTFYPLYFISPEDTGDMQPVGTVSAEGMELLNINNSLQEIPIEEINDTYFRHKAFLMDITKSKYYHLKIPSHATN